MGNRIDIKLFWFCLVIDIIPLLLFGINNAPSTFIRIERTRAARIIETYLVSTLRDVVLEDEPHHRNDTLQIERKLLVRIIHDQAVGIKKCVCIASSIGKLYFLRAGRGRVTATAMSQHHEIVATFGKLELYCPETFIFDCLRFISNSLTILINQEIQSGTHVTHRCPRSGEGKWNLFKTRDAHRHADLLPCCVSIADIHFLTRCHTEEHHSTRKSHKLAEMPAFHNLKI